MMIVVPTSFQASRVNNALDTLLPLAGSHELHGGIDGTSTNRVRAGRRAGELCRLAGNGAAGVVVE